MGERRPHVVARQTTRAGGHVTSSIVAALAGYALGCVCAGYYVVRLFAGDDIRRSGSGTAGATNVGRRFGAGGFAATFFLDCVKGVAVAWAAARYGLDANATSAAILAVTIGHIWPVQLGFRGGKGVATSLGAFALYDPRIVVVIVVLFVVWSIVLRAFVASGLLSYLLAPLVLIALGLSVDRLLTVTAVSALVLIAHRDNIREALAVGRSPAPLKKSL
jgi:acyl phosphate:glycerol-3-phosphate acyltransferase